MKMYKHAKKKMEKKLEYIVLIYIENCLCPFDDTCIELYYEKNPQTKRKDFSNRVYYDLNKNFPNNKESEILEIMHSDTVWERMKMYKHAKKKMEKKLEYIVLIYIENCLCPFDDTCIELYYEKNPQTKRKDFSNRVYYDLNKNFPNNKESEILEIMHSDTVWERMKMYKHAIQELNLMRGMGIDVRLLSNNNNVGAKTKWIETTFASQDWKERAIFVNDLNILEAHYLIHTDPFPQIINKNLGIPNHYTSFKIKNLILFDQPYNNAKAIHIKLKNQKELHYDENSIKRMKAWKTWKTSMELDNTYGKIFYVHGSKDSKDKDVYYVFDKMPSSTFCYDFIAGVEEDRSIICIHPTYGVLTDCMKGNKDECNNSLFSTYKNHEQKFELLVKRKLWRIIPLKFIAVIRKLMGSCINTIYNEKAKILLKSNSTFKQKLEFFAEIEMKEFEHYKVSVLKSLAFQFAQTLSLINGKEIYSKREVSDHYPELKCFMYREEKEMRESLDVLAKLKGMLLDSFRDISFEEFENNRFLLLNSTGKIDNHLKQQCNGLVVDQNYNELVAFPFENETNTSILKPDWVQEQDCWPNLAPQNTIFYSIFQIKVVQPSNNQKNFKNPPKDTLKIFVTSNSSFSSVTNDLVANWAAKYDWDFDNFFYVVSPLLGEGNSEPKPEGSSFHLLAVRSRITYLFVSEEEYQKEKKRIFN
eukprot:TRINITY_DN512_c0_g1_i1.p1 TRINITY_DN512_c0_g1~~TRINITY_DN512_c0_g1_i1.p1  ORF type:complete len:700 (-),score=165.03 TRINITY_DN512_c0_g1_i1:5-2104(-)